MEQVFPKTKIAEKTIMKNSFGKNVKPLPDVSIGQPYSRVFREPLERAFSVLGLSEEEYVECSKAWLEEISEYTLSEEDELICSLRNILSKYDIGENAIKNALEKRAETVSKQVYPHIKNGACLDWGCGSARIAKRLHENGIKVSLLDIEDNREEMEEDKLTIYEENGNNPFEPNTAENVLLLTVLHHARNPGRVVNHVSSVASERIIIIESLPEVDIRNIYPNVPESNVSELQYRYCAFVDWFYNRVFHDDVQVTYNYQKTGGWIQLLNASGFHLEFSENLGIDIDIVPELHKLFVFDCS